MGSFAEQLVKSRHFKTFTEQIIVHHLGYIERVQNRDGNRSVKRRGFSHKPFVTGLTVKGRWLAGEDGGPACNRARGQNAERARRRVSMFESPEPRSLPSNAAMCGALPERIAVIN